MTTQIECSQLRRHQLLADLGVLAAGRGEVQTAHRYADEVRVWSTQRGLQRLIDGAERIAVRVALAEADYEAAYRAAIRISSPGRWTGHSLHHSCEATLYTGEHELAEDMFDSVEAALHTGRRDEARALTAEAVLLNLAEVSPRSAALCIAISAMSAPDTDADELYRSALTHPGIAEFPFEYARIALAQGMWLRRARRHTDARAALEVAVDGFDRLGAKPWAARARAELRAAGASVKQSLGEIAPLSAQQRRIADLAAAGQSTKEIAAQLSLSPRTVDSHLYRMFRKLGVTTRAGLSDALRQHDSELSAAGGDVRET
jgi:DNA-binding CsgD family transcriptional regulator